MSEITRQAMSEGGHPDNHKEKHTYHIKIDRETFKVDQKTMTSQELRLLPTPHIGPDRDLFEVVPGGTDVKISDEMVVKIKDGMRFFTAPAQINPGSGA